jgi:tRNA(Ile)-lysidine synthase TilS/MesJ
MSDKVFQAYSKGLLSMIELHILLIRRKCVIETMVENIISFIRTYNAVEDGDCVGVGVSGGKDSMVMLHALSEARRLAGMNFEIKAFTVSLGFENFDTSPIVSLCSSLGVTHELIETRIGKIVFEVRKEENPCSLCSNMRRGALNKVATDAGCDKLALGHTMDDLIETYLLNILYAGKPSVFSPVTYLSRANLHVIRPIALSTADMVLKYLENMEIITVANPCPADGGDRRPMMRKIINMLSAGNPHIRGNILGAIRRTGNSGW